MNCSVETKQLAFLQDGILPPEEITVLKIHIDSCESCQSRLRELQQIDQSLTDLGMAARLRERTLQEAKRQSIHSMLQTRKESWFQFRPAQWAPAMITIFIAIVAVVYFIKGGSDLNVLIKTGSATMTQLASGVQVALADESFLRVRMADKGSVVEFAPKTKAVVLGPRSIQLDEGATWNQVAPDPEHPYTIQTPHGVVTVLGTEFEVEVTDETVVRVKKGSVRVDVDSSPTTEAQIIQTGFVGRIHDRKVDAPQKNERDSIASWRNAFIPNLELKPKNIADILKGKQ